MGGGGRGSGVWGVRVGVKIQKNIGRRGGGSGGGCQ